MGLKNVNQFSQVLKQQQERMCKLPPSPESNSRELDFQKDLLQTLHRIEAKLDVLLMKRDK